MRPALVAVRSGEAEGTRSLDWERGIDPAAEDAIIANVLVDGSLLDEIRAVLRPEHFFGEACRRVYEACCALRDEAAPIDIVTVATRLRETGRLAQVGGSEAMTELLTSAPAVGPTQVKAHATSVRDKWLRRQLGSLAIRVRSRCENDEAGIDTMLADVRGEVDELARSLADTEASAKAQDVVTRTLRHMESAYGTSGKGSRPTGFDRLDRLTAGLHSELVVLGARPGMGKTSLATSIAVNRALAGDGAYIASLETQDVTLMTRMLCAEARVPMHRARTGGLSANDWREVTPTANLFASLPLWVDETPSQSVGELWARARRANVGLARDGKKLGIVVVDYVQLLRAPRAGMKREEVIAENARALKAMAQDLDCPVLALAQLNRECEKRPDKRPQLSDLRESGELEQCARTVLLLYRADYYRKPGGDDAPSNLAEVHIAKQNNGPTGTVSLRFDEPCLRFDNIAEGECE